MRTIPTRPIEPADAPFVVAALVASWGDTTVVSRGVEHDAARQPGFIATIDEEPAGVLTYDVKGGALEVVTIDALEPRQGVGRALLEAAIREADRRACWRVWLVTTNDNVDALAFYLHCGLRLVAVHLGAVDTARAIKPSIPMLGIGGVRLRDEWELERSFVEPVP
ncbi:MAG: GNAT family N-acetyltransferase [Candidatus Nanopelagicales bacterium]